MDVKALKQITSELSLLYVEDDDNLRDETAKLFKHLFEVVDTAENGKIALEMVTETDYDLVVTDINMPVMDGVKLCVNIREQDLELPILITSAHDESRYLLELIDIGIDKFILKPLDMTKLTSTLMQVCSNISNKKLLKKYKLELEESNMRLTDNNEELELLVQILDKKIEQLSSLAQVPDDATLPKDAINTISKQAPKHHIDIDFEAEETNKGLLLYTQYLNANDLQSLHELQSDIDGVSVLLKLDNSVDQNSVLHLAKIFNTYGNILLNYGLFSNLGKKVIDLSTKVKDNSDIFIENINDILILLESFLYVLRKWKTALFSEGIKNLNVYDTSMINDIDTIVILLQKEKSLPEKNIEFF